MSGTCVNYGWAVDCKILDPTFFALFSGRPSCSKKKRSGVKNETNFCSLIEPPRNFLSGSSLLGATVVYRFSQDLSFNSPISPLLAQTSQAAEGWATTVACILQVLTIKLQIKVCPPTWERFDATPRTLEGKQSQQRISARYLAEEDFHCLSKGHKSHKRPVLNIWFFG